MMKANFSKWKGMRHHAYTYAVALYFILAPLEDLLTSSAGTFAKYISLLAVLLGLLSKRDRFTLKFETLSVVVLYLMLLAAVSVFWASNPDVAFNRIKAYLMLPGFAVFVGMLEFDDRECLFVVRAAALSGFVTVAYLYASGILDISGNGGRLTLNEDNDPNNFASQLLLPLACAFICYSEEPRGFRAVWLLDAVVCLLAIFMTGSRGGLLSVVFMGVVYLLLMGAYRKFFRIVVVVGIAAVAYFVLVPMLPAGIQERLFTLESYESTAVSANQRGAIWRHAVFDIIPNQPPWGYGAGCFVDVLQTYYGYVKGMHNTYLAMIVEYGVFGIPAFVYMLFKLFADERSRGRYASAALLVGICVSIFFLDSFAKKFFWNVVMLLLMYRASDRRKGVPPNGVVVR